MISEDSDYTSDVSYPIVQHSCYGISSMEEAAMEYPDCYRNDLTLYSGTAGYELGGGGYSSHVVRQPGAVIGRRCYEGDDWRTYDGDGGDIYRSAMAYRSRFGTDWELAEPLSYNSRPARFYPCDRYSVVYIGLCGLWIGE